MCVCLVTTGGTELMNRDDRGRIVLCWCAPDRAVGLRNFFEFCHCENFRIIDVVSVA